MKILKLSTDYISLPLTHIFNLCINYGIFHISDGIFPTQMKCSIIKPIYKNNSRYESRNYKPISIVPMPTFKNIRKIIHIRFSSLKNVL